MFNIFNYLIKTLKKGFSSVGKCTSYSKVHVNKSSRVSDVNSPVFLHFWFCYIKSQFFFSIFCFNKYGPSLHCPNLEKKLSHLDIGSLRELLLFYTKISIIYENGSKFAVV